MTLKNWTLWKRWYSRGSFAQDIPMGRFWTRRSALKAAKRYMFDRDPYVYPEGANSIILADEATGHETEVYRW